MYGSFEEVSKSLAARTLRSTLYSINVSKARHVGLLLAITTFLRELHSFTAFSIQEINLIGPVTASWRSRRQVGSQTAEAIRCSSRRLTALPPWLAGER